MKGHVFVLGATGFVGTAVVREAVAAGVRVTALARSVEKGTALAGPGARVVIGDAGAPEAWVRRGRFRAGRLIPLAGAACDYVENVLITALLFAYPARMPALVWVAATWTITKQVCYGLGVLLAIGGVPSIVLRHSRTR